MRIFLVRPLHRDHGSFWETGTGLHHASAYVRFWKNFLSYVLAQLAVGIWCIISVVLVSGSYCSGRLGVAEEFGKLEFSGDAFFVGTTLGLTVDTCSASELW